eukprot:m.36627 g.36627  ORF g.36627 m.36627 type:complete len:375 (+) comp11444_c0_seq1:92-1216(+)
MAWRQLTPVAAAPLLRNVRCGPAAETAAITHRLARSFSSSTSTNTELPALAAHLPHRRVVRVAGEGARKFIQGLVTQDINNLADSGPAGEVGASPSAKPRVLYAFFLNAQGRVLLDTFLHQDPTAPEKSVLLDCDAETVARLLTHLKRYCLRLKLQIEDASAQFDVVWRANSKSLLPKGCFGDRDPRVVGGAMVSTDVHHMQRLIVPRAVGVTEALAGHRILSLKEYHDFRLGAGLGEGPQDFPPENCLPSECNLDYLNGVSWTKGCYLGQELTSRTHFTGVTRKRLLPLQLPSDVNADDLAVDQPIFPATAAEGARPSGKLRGHQGQRAIGLVPVEAAASGQQLVVVGKSGARIPVTAAFPAWWPKDPSAAAA